MTLISVDSSDYGKRRGGNRIRPVNRFIVCFRIKVRKR